MAKKVSSIGDVPSSKKKVDLFKMIQGVDNSVEILEQSVISKIKDWIPSGSYILNACVSGDLMKGFPSGRVSILAGESGCGKSYLACSVCRQAQMKGYKVIYLDSEAAITEDFVSRLGCNTTGDNFMIKQVNTVNETNTFILNLCEAVTSARANGEEVDDIIMVLDSIGNLTSDKERSDAEEGKNVADFTRNKELKKMFRLITVPLAKANIPLIAVNHTYTQIGAFIPTQTMGGGSGTKYASTVTLYMSGSKLEDKENDKAAASRLGASDIKKKGVTVTCAPEKSRLCIPHKVKFQIPFFKEPNPYSGLENYLNWDNAGIMLGKCYTEEEYQKLKPAEQTECKEFEYNGEKRYAQEKKSLGRGVGLVCKHLGRMVSPQEFWSPICFTPEFMSYINDNIFKPEFELPSRDSIDDIREIEKELGLDDDSDEVVSETPKKADPNLISTDMGV